jgi:hypothetical protein
MIFFIFMHLILTVHAGTVHAGDEYLHAGGDIHVGESIA